MAAETVAKPKRLRSPVWYFGGKGNMTAKLLPLLPAHKQYIEPFFGGGSVFFAKQPAEVETINDIDSAVMGFFAVLRDQSEEFIRLAQLTPYSRELYNECRALWREEPDAVRRAWRWWVVARQAFGGRFGSNWCPEPRTSSRGMACSTAKLLGAVAGLWDVSERLRETQIDCRDAIAAMRMCCGPETLAYVDAPYVAATRVYGGYEHEFADADHERLVAALLTLPGKFVVSGYAHPIYKPLEDAGWHRIDWQTACHAAGRTRNSGLQGKGAALAKQPRTETAWLCPRTAAEVRPQLTLEEG